MFRKLKMTFLKPKDIPFRFNGPCFILGSAPRAVPPGNEFCSWTYLTVNASQLGGECTGRTPDITLMSGQMLGVSPVNVEAKRAISGKKTGNLWLIERGVLLSDAIDILENLKYKYENIVSISHFHRACIVYDVLGEDLGSGPGEEKLSTGIFASLLALNQGAKKVVLSGFSLTEAGHSYNDAGHKRCHVDVDRVVLSLIVKKKLPIYSLTQCFSDESGLPLWRNDFEENCNF